MLPQSCVRALVDHAKGIQQDVMLANVTLPTTGGTHAVAAVSDDDDEDGAGPMHADDDDEDDHSQAAARTSFHPHQRLINFDHSHAEWPARSEWPADLLRHDFSSLSTNLNRMEHNPAK